MNSARKSKKNVSIVIWGHIHRDPEAFRLLQNFINQIKQKNLPIIFCEEDHAEQTLQNRFIGNQQFLSINAQLLKLQVIKKFLKKDKNKSLSYFSLTDLPLIKNELGNHFPHLSSHAITEMAWSLLRHSAYQESVQLNNLLIQSNIPYLGIEFSRAKHEEMRKHMSHASYFALEQARIENMKNTIIQHALPKLTNHGVIIVLAGVNHSHRLAANLLLASKKLSKEYDFNIVPLKLFSPYVLDGIPDHQEAVALSCLDDSGEILKAYNQLPFQEFICKEGLEQSPQIANSLKKIIDHCLVGQRNPTRSKQFEYLTTRDLISVSLVSKHWQQLAKIELVERKNEESTKFSIKY